MIHHVYWVLNYLSVKVHQGSLANCTHWVNAAKRHGQEFTIELVK